MGHSDHHDDNSLHNSSHMAAADEAVDTHEVADSTAEKNKQFIRFTVPVAEEAWLFIVPLIALAAPLWYFKLITGLIITLTAITYVIFFFRDLDRSTPQDDSQIYSPADGKIISITRLDENNFLKEECYCVSVFMSLFDNHINRLPIKGEIAFQKHKNGQWLPANSHEASEKNENNAIGVKGKKSNIYLVQVAGLVARRIVSRVVVGDNLDQGERFGLIMFGSRVDLYLPVQKVTINAKVGDRVCGGLSSLASYL